MIHLLLLPLKLFWYGLALVLAIMTAWLVSSLAVHFNGPDWLPWLAGGMIFPIMPIFWSLESLVNEIRAEDKLTPEQLEKQSRKKEVGFMPRLALNTFTLSMTVLLTLMLMFPQESFTALTTRGDWMLDQRRETWVSPARVNVLHFASRLESVYQQAWENPSQAWAEAVASVKTSPVPAVSPSAKTSGKVTKPSWPLSKDLHPAILKMPRSAEKNIQSVAQYIAQRESNPYGRVKAIYDYVATRIAYDAPALAMGQYPPQDALTVFKTRKAVCAGYSRLFMALAHEMGILAVYVTGDARDIQGMTAPGVGHAWNAVQIQGKWHLLDVTWGSGMVENAGFIRRYNPAYLFTPPEVFAMDHYPTVSKWQLRSKPLSREAFERQPMLRAAFFERGLGLQSNISSYLSAKETVTLRLNNPQRQYLLGHLSPDTGRKPRKETTEPVHCQVLGTQDLTVSCEIPKPGAYKLELFSNTRSYGGFEFVGQVKVIAN